MKKTIELEDNMINVRKEDKTIKDFSIPVQDLENYVGDILNINKIKIIKDHQPIEKEVDIAFKKRTRLLVTGPNGIGKSTLLRNLVSGKDEGVKIKRRC